MKINVAKLRKMAGTTENFNLQETLNVSTGRDILLTKPVELNLKITNTGKLLEFKGEVKAHAEVVCSRCLEQFHQTIEAEFHEEFIHVSDYKDFMESLEDEDIEYKFYESDTIVLDDIVIENLMLHLPMQLLCKDDCSGLCIVCGQNLNEGKCQCKAGNVDPRLAILAKLKDGLET